jgi:hypothetical protein
LTRTPWPASPAADNLVLMRVVAIVLFLIAAVVAALALWVAVAFGREYGVGTFWLTIAWGVVFTLVPLVPGILLLKRSRRKSP